MMYSIRGDLSLSPCRCSVQCKCCLVMHRQWSELNCKLVLLCVCFLCIPRRHRIIWKRLPVARRRGMDDNKNDKDDDCMLSEMIPLIHCTAVNWWCTDASLNIDYTTQSQWLLHKMRKTNNYNIGRFLFCQKKKNERTICTACMVSQEEQVLDL